MAFNASEVAKSSGTVAVAVPDDHSPWSQRYAKQQAHQHRYAMRAFIGVETTMTSSSWIKMISSVWQEIEPDF
jgi:hypothetical protein